MKQNSKIVITDFCHDLKDNFLQLFSLKTFYRQIPNLLTTFRLLVLIPFNILYFTNHKLAAIIILIIAFLTDAVDGKIARKYNLTSRFGANLDAISDKLMVIFIIVPICHTHYGLIINLALEIIIAVINTWSCALGVKVKSSSIGKLKTWPLFITIAVAHFSSIYQLPSIILTSMICITAFLQIFTAIDYISKNANIYCKTKK